MINSKGFFMQVDSMKHATIEKFVPWKTFWTEVRVQNSAKAFQTQNNENSNQISDWIFQWKCCNYECERNQKRNGCDNERWDE